jgi:hypothetical protein
MMGVHRMDAEQFGDAVNKLIRMAREDGVEDEELIAELEGIIAGLKGE